MYTHSMMVRKQKTPKGHEIPVPTRKDFEDALEAQRQAVTVYIVGMDEAMKGPSTYERGQTLAALVGDLQISLDDSKPVLERARKEPEGHEPCESAGYLLPCGTDCSCYQAGLGARERV